MAAPPIAAGQERSPTPSAEELWRTYPLEQTPEPGATPAPSAATALTPPASAPRAADDGAPPALIGAAALLAALAAGLALVRVRPRPSVARPRWAVPLLPATAAVTMLPGRRPRSPRLTALGDGPPPATGGAPDGGVRPPDPGRAWIAEVEWDDTRFAVVVRKREGGTGVRLATSAPLPWPPADAKAVRDLTRAAEHLEASLLAGGWTPLAPGAAWYAKRFAWAAVPPGGAPVPPAPREPAVEPVAPLPRTDAEPRTGRFARQVEWPAGSEALWRCEIKWHAGYVNSRFDAVAHAPKRLRSTSLGRSEVFKWLLMGDPDEHDADHVKEVRQLADRLVASGWEPAGRGRHWHELRFVWRREDAAPEPLEPVSAEAGR